MMRVIRQATAPPPPHGLFFLLSYVTRHAILRAYVSGPHAMAKFLRSRVESSLSSSGTSEPLPLSPGSCRETCNEVGVIYLHAAFFTFTGRPIFTLTSVLSLQPSPPLLIPISQCSLFSLNQSQHSPTFLCMFKTVDRQKMPSSVRYVVSRRYLQHNSSYVFP